jgi:hypothetical protein
MSCFRMNGSGVLADGRHFHHEGLVPPLPDGWQVATTGDFNNDDKRTFCCRVGTVRWLLDGWYERF